LSDKPTVPPFGTNPGGGRGWPIQKDWLRSLPHVPYVQQNRPAQFIEILEGIRPTISMDCMAGQWQAAKGSVTVATGDSRLIRVNAVPAGYMDVYHVLQIGVGTVITGANVWRFMLQLRNDLVGLTGSEWRAPIGEIAITTSQKNFGFVRNTGLNYEGTNTLTSPGLLTVPAGFFMDITSGDNPEAGNSAFELHYLRFRRKVSTLAIQELADIVVI